jgi:hypothetical protein
VLVSKRLYMILGGTYGFKYLHFTLKWLTKIAII